MHSERYALPTILLHWLGAILIVAAFGLALALSGMHLSPLKFKMIAWHKWLGITVLGVTALRLLARLVWKAPAMPADMSPAMQRIAHLGHLALYLFMLAIPLSGWAMSSAYGIPIVYLAKFTLPDLIGANEALGAQLKTVHVLLNWTLAAIVAGHVLAALKHHFVDRNGLLWRMSPHAPKN
ncbi:cytochrome b [Paludibacterium yongneupense]|uniref:cytochrome b n=1 Tax=Paludibacterium yongneupense TaxID=400061 RepID=UPI0004910333|nr:cytochrome b [Paludibacterium yongneupense]